MEEGRAVTEAWIWDLKLLLRVAYHWPKQATWSSLVPRRQSPTILFQGGAESTEEQASLQVTNAPACSRAQKQIQSD